MLIFIKFMVANMKKIYIKIDFNLVPPKISHTSVSQTKKEGSSLSLECKSSGEPEAVIEWRSTSNKSLTFNNSTGLLKIQVIDKTDAGNYTCTASNLAGSDSYTITVKVECKLLLFC